ncbi:MAG: hypothetical protein AB9869_30925 [Verrucomicrobiia bacterium]
MNERILPPRERDSGSGSASSVFDAAPDVQLPVSVSCGPYGGHLPVGNMTVGEIRRRFRDRLDLDPDSQAVLNGQDVGDDTVVRPGESLRFTRRAGEKG